eukprot:m.967889 g.967889  ORF g.967889 m.967889 type:complete len:1234 (+) comp23914_c0_seq6:423-4124(+)
MDRDQILAQLEDLAAEQSALLERYNKRNSQRKKRRAGKEPMGIKQPLAVAHASTSCKPRGRAPENAKVDGPSAAALADIGNALSCEEKDLMVAAQLARRIRNENKAKFEPRVTRGGVRRRTSSTAAPSSAHAPGRSSAEPFPTHPELNFSGVASKSVREQQKNNAAGADMKKNVNAVQLLESNTTKNSCRRKRDGTSSKTKTKQHRRVSSNRGRTSDAVAEHETKRPRIVSKNVKGSRQHALDRNADTPPPPVAPKQHVVACSADAHTHRTHPGEDTAASTRLHDKSIHDKPCAVVAKAFAGADGTSIAAQQSHVALKNRGRDESEDGLNDTETQLPGFDDSQTQCPGPEDTETQMPLATDSQTQQDFETNVEDIMTSCKHDTSTKAASVVPTITENQPLEIGESVPVATPTRVHTEQRNASESSSQSLLSPRGSHVVAESPLHPITPDTPTHPPPLPADRPTPNMPCAPETPLQPKRGVHECEMLQADDDERHESPTAGIPSSGFTDTVQARSAAGQGPWSQSLIEDCETIIPRFNAQNIMEDGTAGLSATLDGNRSPDTACGAAGVHETPSSPVRCNDSGPIGNLSVAVAPQVFNSYRGTLVAGDNSPSSTAASDSVSSPSGAPSSPGKAPNFHRGAEHPINEDGGGGRAISEDGNGGSTSDVRRHSPTHTAASPAAPAPHQTPTGREDCAKVPTANPAHGDGPGAQVQQGIRKQEGEAEVFPLTWHIDAQHTLRQKGAIFTHMDVHFVAIHPTGGSLTIAAASTHALRVWRKIPVVQSAQTGGENFPGEYSENPWQLLTNVSLVDTSGNPLKDTSPTKTRRLGITALQFSQCGTAILVGGSFGVDELLIRRYCATTMAELAPLRLPASGRLTCLAIEKKTNKVISACWDEVCYTLTLAVWSIPTRTEKSAKSGSTPSQSPTRRGHPRRHKVAWSATNTKPMCVVLPRYDSSLPLTSLAVVQHGAAGDPTLVIGVHENLAVLWNYHTQQLVATFDIAPDDVFPPGSAHSLLAPSPQRCMEALGVPGVDGARSILVTLGTPGGTRAIHGDWQHNSVEKPLKDDHERTAAGEAATSLPPCHRLLLSWVATPENSTGHTKTRPGNRVDGAVRFVDEILPRFRAHDHMDGAAAAWSFTSGCAMDVHHIAMGTSGGHVYILRAFPTEPSASNVAAHVWAGECTDGTSELLNSPRDGDDYAADTNSVRCIATSLLTQELVFFSRSHIYVLGAAIDGS